jgi:hypothetical protein
MRSFLLLLALGACVTGEPAHVNPAPTGKADDHDHHEPHDPAAVHGMALFGEAQTGVFLSHLPMFHRPHDYQVLLRAELATDFRIDKRELHTIAPRAFELALAKEPGFVMTVDVYRGHFERGGTRLGRTTARITEVIAFEKLVPTTPRPAEPSFYLFGNTDDAYLVHVITSRPDFDQIVRVRVPAGLDLTPSKLPLPGRSAEEPLAVGETVSGLEVLDETYFELADLAH